MKLMFVDVKKAHLSGRCDEAECIELPEQFSQYGKYARLRMWLYGMRQAASWWDGPLRAKTVFRRGHGRQGSGNAILPLVTDVGVVHGDRLHVRWIGSRTEEGTSEDA